MNQPKINQLKIILIVILLGHFMVNFAQTLSDSRSTDWSLAGFQEIDTVGALIINVEDHGLVGDGKTPNDIAFNAILTTNNNSFRVFQFPAGDYLFNQNILLGSNVLLKGLGAQNTTLTFDLTTNDHSIYIEGNKANQNTIPITKTTVLGEYSIVVEEATTLAINDWIRILHDDKNEVTSTWAEGTVGQIVQIKNIENNKITLISPLRIAFELSTQPYIEKISPVSQVGVECLKIRRKDNTAPKLTSNIRFSYAVNSWVRGVDFDTCTFAHVDILRSSNIYVGQSYFHHGFEYGGSGRAYGVALHYTSNECLIENNIFEHLRHSVLLQAGANGNVIAYNYSIDPYWSSIPNDAAGDMVLHGNYPFLNLFEHNICQNIVIDNSHGQNGPNNTFFRNRSEKFGVFFSDDSSPHQNFIGNDITNTSSPYSFVNYSIKGDDHYLYGNNVKGSITPVDTEELEEKSLYYEDEPGFLMTGKYASIGTPNTFDDVLLPAQRRYDNNIIFNNACGNENDFNVISSINKLKDTPVEVFPNPAESILYIKSAGKITKIEIWNLLGRLCLQKTRVNKSHMLDITNLPSGYYLVQVDLDNGESILKKIILQ